MKKYSVCLFSVFLCLLSTYGFAQLTYEIDRTTRFEKIAAEEGLSSKYLTCIHQDKYGFIWIGTQLGLNLYDGYEFKVFKYNPEDPQSICWDDIFNIYEETDGTMWFCTDAGISKFNRANQTFTNYTMEPFGNPQHSTKKLVQDGDDFWIHVWHDLYRFNKKTGEFTSFAHNPKNPSKGIMGTNVSRLLMDKSGVLWIGSGDNEGNFYLSRFTKETEEFIHFQNIPSNPESFNGDEIWSMTEDQDGNIWIATDGGGLLKLIDRDKGKFKHYLHDVDDANTILSNKVYSVIEDSRGMIWIGADGGFSIFNRQTEQFTNYPIPPRIHNPKVANKIGIITESNNGDYWLDAQDGIFRYNSTTQVLKHYLHDPEIPTSLSSNIVQELLIDHSGQLWVLLNNKGLNRLNEFSNVFIQIKKKANVDHSLTGNAVGLFYGDSKGNLWIGTNGGLNRTKLNQQKTYTHFEHFIRDPNNPNSMSSNIIFSMYEDRDENLWFGTWYGLNKYDYKTNSFTRFFHNPDDESTISAGTIESIYEDSHGTLWFGTRSGLNIFNKKTNKFIRLLHDDSDSTSLLSNSVRAIIEDSYGELWIGGTYLEKLNRKDTSFIPHFTGYDNDDAISPIEVWDIVEVDSVKLWIKTMRSGIYILDRNDNTFTRITIEQSLSGTHDSPIKTNGNEYIWALGQGLYRINTSDYTVKSFDVKDGLTNLEFTGKSLYTDDDGWMYLGGNNGFNIFHPDSIKDNTFIPPVHITSLTVAGQPRYFEKPVYETQGIELKYNENDLSIDYVALNYINAKKNKYASMLQGYDEDWKYVDKRRTAYFTNLSPGEYTFKVKASNNDGYWNETGASLDILIRPPFWATWWACTIYLILFVSTLYVIFRFYFRRQQLLHKLELKQLESDKLVELDHLKSRFFSNVSHEFRTPLTLILGPVEKILKKSTIDSERKELGMARKYAKQLQNLVNQILSISKLESGKLKLKTSAKNIVKLTSGYLQAFESLAKQNSIRLTLDSAEDKILVYLDTEKFEQIINNMLSNAFKFTENGGAIEIKISHQIPSPPQNYEGIQDSVKITISDDGRGIPPEHIDHVFDRFYQVEQPDGSYTGGTGIGLALSKELVELHHGVIKVESEFNKGTTFTITFPTGKDHLNPEEIVVDEIVDLSKEQLNIAGEYNPEDVPESEKDADLENNKPILLIVEDNADMRKHIRGYFDQHYKIVEAVDGLDGFNKSIEFIPDIIISDVMMPNMDGNEFCKRIKTDLRTSHVPLILLTARASKEYRIESYETGADEFITKPFDADELIIRVENLIQQRKKLQEYYLNDIEFVDSALTMDEQFMQKAKDVAQKNLSNPEYSIERFASDMALSRVQLHRKLRALLNNSASEFIRNLRLNYAKTLLKVKAGNVSEIAYDAGFNNPTYFSHVFRKKFGLSPSDFQKINQF